MHGLLATNYLRRHVSCGRVVRMACWPDLHLVDEDLAQVPEEKIH